MQFPSIRRSLLIIEVASVTLLFFGLGWLLSRQGGLQGSDNLYYMQVGIDHIADPAIYNRYVHVYFIRFFSWLAQSYVVGFRVYYAFLISVTGILVYFLARTFTRRSNPIHGALAAAFYLGMPFIVISAGSPEVDLAAAMMVLLFLGVYRISAHANHLSSVLLVLMGLLFFLAFKTKETTIFSGIVLLGIGLQDGREFNWKLLIKNGLRVLMGVGLGMLLFIIMNSIYLRDPFFGLLPSYFAGFARNYSNTTVFNVNPENWFTSYLTTTILGAFLFYVLSGVKAREENLPAGLKLIWAVPLLLVAFLTLTEIRSTWGLVPRYFIPAIPIICFLAPQFIDYEPKTLREWGILGIGAVVLAGLAVAMSNLLQVFVAGINWNYSNFLKTIIAPIALSGILLLIFLNRRLTLASFFLFLSLFIMFNYDSLITNERQLVVTKDAQVIFEDRMQPFSTFQQQLEVSPEMRLLVSSEIAARLQVKDRVELLNLFNYYFYANTRRENYKIAPDIEALSNELSSTPYQYALVTVSEWNAVSQAHAPGWMVNQYSTVEGENTNMVLLKGL